MIDPQLLQILACPACHGGLSEDGDVLTCKECGLRYPVRNGIPVLLVDEAQRAPGGADQK